MLDIKKIKDQLFIKCNELIAQKIIAIKDSLNEVQEAANNETKSSAGDKHETGRAMAQLETEKLTKQLSEALKLEQVLDQINPELEHLHIGLGSLVITNNGNFYISVSLGKTEIDDNIYFAISSVSPIGEKLLGLKINDELLFNDKKYSVNEII